MIWHKEFPVLIIDDELNPENEGGRKSQEILKELKLLEFPIIAADTGKDGLLTFMSQPNISCVVLDWDLEHKKGDKFSDPYEIVLAIRRRNKNIPLFLMTEKITVQDLPLKIVELINGYIWKLEDTADFIAGRIEQAADRYLEKLLPPFFKELMTYVDEYKYSWHTPGHMGGVAFLKSATGRMFYQFFGENAFRSDLSVSVPELA